MVQFIYLGFRIFESFLSGSSQLVYAAFAALNDLQPGPKKAGAFHSVQQWIEGTRTDAVSVVAKLLHQRKAEDVLVRRVHEDVDSNQTGKQFPLMLEHIMNIPSERYFYIV